MNQGLKYKLLNLALVITFTKVLLAQNIRPFPGPVFDDSYLPEIYIIIDQDSLDNLLLPGNEYSNHEYPATFIFKGSSFIDTVNEVGFRLRGNTSRVSAKKSFKVSFNTFSNQDFYGFEKLNLNGEHNDPSIIRSKLFWNITYAFSNPGSRSNHIKLYINGEYKGLYINVEHVDENFVQSRFGNHDGNLYKCLYPADLAWLGSNPDVYKLTQYGRRVYDLKTNTGEDNYSDLAQFIDVLNNTPLQNLPVQLEAVFNVNRFIKYLAVEAFTGHWDGYSFNKNNFYLYHNTESGLFEFIPYDVDNTFGIDWMDIDWGTRNIYSWANPWEDRVLTTRVLSVPEYLYRYEYYLRCLSYGVAAYDSLSQHAMNIRSQIQDAVVQDTYHGLDYGYTYGDFMNSYVSANGAHVKYGLLPYIQTRLQSIYSQVNINDFPPIISQVSSNASSGNQTLKISAKIENDGQAVNAWLLYGNSPGNLYDSVLLYDDGLHNDSYTGDLIFSNTFNYIQAPSVCYYVIKAYEESGLWSRFPRSGVFQINPPELEASDLVLNEAMAKNDFTFSDEYGEYDDWIELFNKGSESIFLGDYYLSDKISNPLKWKLPEDSLAAGEYRIIWADNDTNQGIWHTSFKLSSNGEEVILTKGGTPVLTPTDKLVFGQQESDISVARFPNGSGPFSKMLLATPNQINAYLPLELTEENTVQVKVYPNPVVQLLHISVPSDIKVSELQIFNSYGQVLQSKTPAHSTKNIEVQMESYQPGIYFLRLIQLENAEKRYLYYKVIKI